MLMSQSIAPVFVCHGNQVRLADSIISLGGALSMRRMFSASELEKLGPQFLMLSEAPKCCCRKEPILPDLCLSCFWLDRDGWKDFTVVNKVVQLVIVTSSGRGYVPDFEDLSFSCLA